MAETNRPTAPSQVRLEEDSDNYIYESLESEDQMRVLELYPGQDEEPINCSLTTVKRIDAPPYEALSYAWGDHTDRKEIRCDGKQLTITRSLYDALWRIRDVAKVKLLWADAICINQADRQERGHQVKHMGSIYFSAERVLVWVGLDNPFESFQESFESLVNRFFRPRKLHEHRVRLVDSRVKNEAEMGIFCRALAYLIHRPWFSRLWVVQEVGLGRSALVLFGIGEQIDFDSFLMIIDCVESNANLNLRYISDSGRILNTFVLFPRRARNELVGGVDDFLEVMTKTMAQEASDHRDYIYALLGHPSALVDGRLIVQPDYTRSELDVFRQLTITLVEHTQSLRVLSAVCHRADSNLDEPWPTWIATWDREIMPVSLGLFRYDRQFYDASAGFDGTYSVDGTGEVLRVEGFVFDSVDECTGETVMPGDGVLPESMDHVFAHHLDCAMQFKAWREVPVQQRLSELSIVMCAGRPLITPRTRQQQQDLESAFTAYRLSLYENHVSLSGNDALLPEGMAAAQLNSGADPELYRYFARRLPYMESFSTATGMLGVGRRCLRPGDICCILFGSNVPMILRPVGSRYRLVGPAYIYQVAQGEAMVDYVIGEKFPKQTFEIF
ncbi:heterokaryon incompatibility protein-domain-containing protein [Massariosphaeria phaeospora]|uniref:Heterokaryon incompatibility protein-domain-containing protein n=1 Tax=Massariosphaeria phaeospora TaxID=100035 RepID=A0A7C8MG92_9PLEO|nr:heterokaryon incompatibility protein-domain-containing protein [Massariosphaeria phaeospora]